MNQIMIYTNTVQIIVDPVGVPPQTPTRNSPPPGIPTTGIATHTIPATTTVTQVTRQNTVL